ncbi:MAG TPA: 2-oxo acid dehydrogenase subunit E2 [Pseudonocardiaceae bacterium]|nr:2-oxo acid dehydrogenase subunit E2 [Pseudonocardiaceae bacterium]
MVEITVPKLNNNDDTYVVVEWLFEDGQRVRDGDTVAVVETSKAAEDLLCDTGGILHRFASVSDSCKPGDVIGRLFATEDERRRHLAEHAPTTVAPAPLAITDSARALMQQHGITEDRLRGLGKTVIKRADVEPLVDAAATAVRADRTQQAVAAVVTESHRTVPAAFTLAKVDVDAVSDLARGESERTGGPVGLTEFLVKAIAELRGEFPTFFAAPRDPELVAANRPRVGVTVDLGKGLFIPVVPDPASMSVAQVADLLMDFRIKAMRGEFRERDFADAGIVLSLNNEPGIVFARPIIFPGQVCMLSLGATMDELTIVDGEIRRRRVAHIGITYDHRVVNGRDAVLFLKKLTAVLAEPARLALA